MTNPHVLSEYFGESYFDYLAALPDLMLLMDESHRYRASAVTENMSVDGLAARYGSK